MMKRTMGVLAVVVFAAVALSAQPSGYAGQHTRDIKALSETEIASLLAGEGMGFAKAAELNHYPGPRHVLQAADELGLSAAQRKATQRAFDAMQAEARRLGRAVVEKEAELERLFRTGAATDHALRALLLELARLQGELRYAHLRAHLLVADLLSREQIAKYDELRGYHSVSHGEHQH